MFFFEDSNKSKKRPVLFVDEKNEICFVLKITENTKRIGVDEYTIKKWKEAGLKCKSNIRLAKYLPIGSKYLTDKLGVLQKEDRDSFIDQMNKFLLINNAKYSNNLVKN